ncbi:Protein of unknown function DUF2946 [Burkholderiales bacterium]
MFDLVQLRRTSFLALLAMVMLALAPMVSKVIAAERIDSNLVEVCTTEGTKWLSASELGQVGSVGHDQRPSSLHDHGGNCPYCNLQATKFLSSVVQTCSSTKPVVLVPPLFYQAPKPLFVWALQPARAPPHISVS